MRRRLAACGMPCFLHRNRESRGRLVEFLRDSTGRVSWLRLKGRVLARDR